MITTNEAFKNTMHCYIDSAKTEGQLAVHATLSIAAWNMSLRPRSEWEYFTRDTIDKIHEFGLHGIEIDLQNILYELTERKLIKFPNHLEMISEIEITDNSDGIEYNILRV